MDQGDFELFPNPFDQSLMLRYESVEARDFTLKLCDVAGHTFFNQVLGMTEGSNYLQIELDKNLPQGLYFVSLQAPNMPVVTKKLIKVKD